MKTKKIETFIYDQHGKNIGQVDNGTTVNDLKVVELYERRYVYVDGIICLKIDDKRDKKELARRREKGIFQPAFDELYTYNPNFDGNYQ